MTELLEPKIINFGCRLNAYESEAIRSALLDAQVERTIVVHTCAVTKEAERQARQAIRRARKENPDAHIVVTGCAAQINPAQFSAMPEVSKVIGNQEKFDAHHYVKPDLALPEEERVVVNDIMSVKTTASHLVHSFEGKARAFVQIQNGCNHRCTFCIIPYGRGNSRSVPVAEIVSQVRMLVEQGFQEVVLTGVDITDYGKDLPGEPSLGEMMQRLLRLVPELARLRLSSLDVAEVDPVLLSLLQHEPRVMPHVHISLQAGNNMILKRMKRRHTREDVLNFCHSLRAIRSDVAFGADIIAGFPTEEEAMFRESVALVREAKIHLLHVFPYSAREGTPAARMPQMPMAIRKERAAQLRAEGERQYADFLSAQIGKEVSVVAEKSSIGRTENFCEILSNAPLLPGQLYRMRVCGVEGQQLQGMLL